MIEEGAMEAPRVDRAISLHVWQDLPVGMVGVAGGGPDAWYIFCAPATIRVDRDSCACFGFILQRLFGATACRLRNVLPPLAAAAARLARPAAKFARAAARLGFEKFWCAKFGFAWKFDCAYKILRFLSHDH